MQPDHRKKSPKQAANKSIDVQDAKFVEKPKAKETQYKKIFQTGMPLAGFVIMIKKFNEAQKQAIHNTGFAKFIALQATEFTGDLCKWLVDKLDPTQ